MLLHCRSTRRHQRRPLGRSKSTGSIRLRSTFALHSDPIVAERDAHIAARLSYQRAYGRKSEGMAPLSEGTMASSLDGGDGCISIRDVGRSDNPNTRTGESREATPRIVRQRSIRFTGPKARPRRPLGSRAIDNRETTTSADDDSSYLGRGDRHVGALSEGHNDSTVPALSPLRAGQLQEEEYKLEEALVTRHSSYRRLPRSRSMITTSELSKPGYSFTSSPTWGKENTQTSRYARLNVDDTPKAETRISRLSRHASLNMDNKPKAGPEVRSMRASKSMSFLPGRQQQRLSEASTTAPHDLAVQMARQRFQELSECQTSLRSRPSLFFGSRSRRPEASRRSDTSMGMRKSLRHSSNSSATLFSAYAGDSLSTHKQGSLRDKARNVSRSIKSRLREIFGRQEVSEGSAHFADYRLGTDSSYTKNKDRVHREERASLSRGPSRTASLHIVHPCQQTSSDKGSLVGGEEENAVPVDEKSRVTSWADSLTNTAISHASPGDWEHRPLAAIKEGVPHGTSSTPLRRMEDPELVNGNTPTVDSQRIYSALMKRAREIRERDEEAQQRIHEMRAHGDIPPRTSSVDRVSGSYGWSPPTIRCVQPEDDVFQDGRAVTQSEASGSLSRQGSPNPWARTSEGEPSSLGKGGVSCHTNGDRTTLLTQRSSAFFGSPSNHLFRTASPFRRALQENMKAAEEERKNRESHGDGPEYPGSPSAISLPDRQPSPPGSGAEALGIYAESVYSSPAKTDAPEPPAVELHGGTRFRSGTEVSTDSSVAWKARLSSHVAKLEDAAADVNYSLTAAPSSSAEKKGHVRETAEIVSSPDGSPKNIRRASGTIPLKTPTDTFKFHSWRNAVWRPRREIRGVENEPPSSSPAGGASTKETPLK
ncbi:hypothetical protein ACRE_035630 [Hapsidospora chrysogenum ATCC 11550]|uniref:Uncharacterized protein n=1 Tax=Hapsidospora chrysogenum (strain ATCC 11550 / CBS 779.69 / DSM 880 / IAM 14645 / JCM 23072 / IMI 49137) TaxID=857340 RepID=A0A086T8F7_HAPC1|nr:hypothetical protein ACRE_035630 [Hapsidospora chrysogenum ATCC 11550]